MKSRVFIRFHTSIGKSQGRIVILGTGWAGFKLVRSLDFKNYQIVVVSPRNYFVFTPLLASTCVCGQPFDISIVEPIRHKAKDLNFYEAVCQEIDFSKNRIKCSSSISNEEFVLDYDKLVIACGAISNTFNIPGLLTFYAGVKEYAYFLKDINDARKIRLKVIECTEFLKKGFENAQQPNRSEEEQCNLLHFTVVGGGPTGIEFSAELYDFIKEDLSKLYPKLMDKVQMTVFDVADKILKSFDSSLSNYATTKFSRQGINIRLGAMVKEITQTSIIFQDGQVVMYGLLVWATGLTSNSLVKSLNGVLKDKSGRLITNDFLQLFNKENGIISNVYALGDCALIQNQDLPCTAQVANQKAKYLSKILNGKVKGFHEQPFTFNDMGSMAYVGNWKAVYDNKNIKGKGVWAWLFWRSAYFTMAVSLKNKMLIPMYWFLTWVFGRDTSRL